MRARVRTLLAVALLCSLAPFPREARAVQKEEPTTRTPAQLAREAELAEIAKGLLDAYVNQGPGIVGQLTRDGKRILFGSNRDGSPQAYLGEVARPAAAPKPVTRGPERVMWASFSRDERWVLYSRDRGADENYHLYRMAPDGSGVVDLTPGEGVRNDPPVLPLRKPDIAVFAQRRVTAPTSTFLVMPLAGGPARRVYEDPAPAFAIDAAPDGSRALALRLVSPSDSILLELDLASGKARRIHPAEGRKEYVSAAAYSSDGTRVFLATDEGGERTSLFSVEIASGKIGARYAVDDPATASIANVTVSPRGDLLAIQVDAGNRSEIRLLDAKILAQKTRLKAPIGTALLGEFKLDGTQLTIGLSTPDSPPEPYAVSTATGEAKKLRDDPRPGAKVVALDTSIQTAPAFDGKPIPLNVSLPRVRGEKKLPVIVDFHGGPAASSEVGWSPYNQFFASIGYAVVQPNIRGSTGFGRAWEMADNRERRGDVLKDMETVNRWVRAQPWADPQRIVISGGSYGGYLVLMGLTRQPGLWSAGLDLVGVADLSTLLESTDQAIRAIFVDEFGDLDKDAALLAEWSPLKDASKIAAPLFVYQGANDPRVLRSESDAIVGALRQRGVPVEYMVAPDEGHSLARRANRVEYLSRVGRFLEEHLVAGHASRQPGAR